MDEGLPPGCVPPFATEIRRIPASVALLATEHEEFRGSKPRPMIYPMGIRNARLTMKLACRPSLLALMLCTAPLPLRAQAPTPTPVAPAWAQPGSATHVQVAPPADFHRPSKNFDTPIGIFEGQSDIGSALVPGSASYDASTKQYTINSAGYNVWYTRDEFRYLWKKMSGDVSLAADITYPDRTAIETAWQSSPFARTWMTTPKRRSPPCTVSA